MLQPKCDICRKEIDGMLNTTEHFCDRCLPFAGDFKDRQAVVTAEALNAMRQRLDRFRNEFIRDVINPLTKPKLEAIK